MAYVLRDGDRLVFKRVVGLKGATEIPDSERAERFLRAYPELIRIPQEVAQAGLDPKAALDRVLRDTLVFFYSKFGDPPTEDDVSSVRAILESVVSLSGDLEKTNSRASLSKSKCRLRRIENSVSSLLKDTQRRASSFARRKPGAKEKTKPMAEFMAALRCKNKKISFKEGFERFRRMFPELCRELNATLAKFKGAYQRAYGSKSKARGRG